MYTQFTFENVFQYRKGDTYWCTADVGWITGHSYIVYGPLLTGAKTILFEGVSTYPDASRFWKVIDKYKKGKSVLYSPYCYKSFTIVWGKIY